MSESPAIKTTNRGAILDKFTIGGQNILLGFPHPSLYTTHPHPHFGETIGRTTNRIANSKLTNLNGKDYTLNANNGPNNLHGGKVGWGARDWTGPTFVRRGDWDEGVRAIKPAGWDDGKAQGQKGREGWSYEILSEDGEEGFPGSVVGRVWYFEGRGQKGEVVLDAEYEIVWQDDDKSDAKETVVGITQHG
jgi:aldose 1-epimerase